MNNLKALILLFAFVALMSLGGLSLASSSGNVYHVSPAGDDASPGTESLPWRTISYGLSQLRPGDTLIIHGGTYEEVIVVSISGTPDARITIKGAEGEDVILDFGGAYSNCFVFSRGASYLNIENLKLRSCGVWTISFDGENRYVTLSDLDLEGGESGIHMTVGYSGEEPLQGPVEYITIKDSKIHDTAYSAIDCTPGPCNYLFFRRLEIYGAGVEAGFGADGIAVETGNHIVVDDVYSHDNGGDGIDIGSRNPLAFKEASDVKVSRSRVEKNKMNGVKLWTGGVVENTIIYDNCLSPLVFVYDGDYLVVNSIIAGNSRRPDCRDYSATIGYPEIGALGGQDHLRVRIYNTIFAFNGPPGAPTGIYVGRGVSLTSDYNIWYSRQDSEIYMDSTQRDYGWEDITGGRWTAETGNGENSMVADPMFVNLEVGDLHLRAASPAIDAGTAEHCPEIDIEGGVRPTGRGCDIGAYEYAAAPITVTTTAAWPTTITTQPTTAATTTSPETLTQRGTTLQTVTQTFIQPTTQTITETKPFTATQLTSAETATEKSSSQAPPQPKPEESQLILWLVLGLAAGAMIASAISLVLRHRS